MTEMQVAYFQHLQKPGATHGGRQNVVRCRSEINVRSTLHNVNEKGYKGIRYRPELGRYISEIRPAQPRKRKIWLGTYKTAEEAALAFDAGIFYTGKPIAYNFVDSPSIFQPLPQGLSPEEEHTEIQKKAKAAAGRAQPVPHQQPAAVNRSEFQERSTYGDSIHFYQQDSPRNFPQEIRFSVLDGKVKMT